jgi:tetratricopeptide (TPR) repeat protein
MSAAASDRNLLFGILALQVNFIGRDALIRGMNAWVLQKHRTLADILAEQGALKAENRALLEPLVEQHLKEHGNDPQQSLVAISSVGSVRDDLEQIADPELCRSLDHVSARREEDAPATRPPAQEQNDQAEVPATRPPSVGTPTSSGLRFRILRPHARGGLGEVFVARDEELHREVALKEIQGRHADHPDSRTRFVLEAEITGGLEHPGIVPVYGLGHYADGRPFYAMRFIRGDSLQQAIEAFHKADVPGRDAGERTLSLRQLLGRFVDVCNAIAYAHSRGVLHRDLKPGNIMLGQYGETLVVDWGLAKAGSTTDQPVSAEGPLRPTTASGSAPTQMGQAFGTPEYMSPEQAAGRLDLLGPATDVYSLGATLYCLLTGKTPFEGADSGALLQLVQKGDFPALRQVKRNVPAALQAICLKAMALRPEDRYASVRALADDVEHWLADEPVSAWREPWVKRAGRWVRKHRVLAATVAASVVVALVLGTAGAVWLQQRKAQERLVQLARQERACERAEATIKQAAGLRKRMHWKEARVLLDQARDAVNEAEDQGLEERLQQAEADLALAHELDCVREETSVLVAGRYHPDRVKDRYPGVFNKHGLNLLDGSVEELADYIRASAIREEILAALDDWTAWESEPKRKQRLLELTGRIDQHNRWRKQFLTPRNWRNPRHWRGLLAQVNEESLAPSTAVFLAGVLGSVTPEAQKLLERVRERNPDDFWLNAKLAAILTSSLGDSAEKPHLCRQEEAIGYCRAALAVKRSSALVHYILGDALCAKGDKEGAIRSYREALRLDPKVAEAHTNLGVVLHDKGDVEGAIRSHREAIRLDPKLAEAHNNLADALRAKGDKEGAFRSWLEAVRLDPTNAKAHGNLGKSLWARGDVDGAIRSYREAIRLDPKDAKTHNNLGIALEAKEDLEGAIRSHREAIRLDPKFAEAHNNLGVALAAKEDLEGASRSFREAVTLAPRLAPAHCNLGLMLHAMGDLDGAIRSYREAVRLDPKDAKAHSGLGDTLAHYGDFANARESFRQASKHLPPAHPLSQDISKRLALCQRLLELEPTLDAVVAGKLAPRDSEERIALAFIALRPAKQLYTTAVRLYSEAFQVQPHLADDLRFGHRYNAACAAARAGTGQGKDVARLNDTDRAEMCYRAISWLQDDLGAKARKLAGGGQDAEQSREALLHWRKDPDLAAVRDSAALAKLPEAEQVAWRNLWAQVDSLLARTMPSK